MAGLYHVRFRVYDPEMGRWTRRDPIGYVDGMGLYEYVRGKAVASRDPNGLLSLPCGGLAGPCYGPPRDEPVGGGTNPIPPFPPCLNMPQDFAKSSCRPGDIPSSVCNNSNITKLLDQIQSECGCSPKVLCTECAWTSTTCGWASPNIVGCPTIYTDSV